MAVLFPRRDPATRTYIVAYPHPSIRPLHRTCVCEVGSEACTADLLSQLCEQYPRYTEDLKRATLWRASRCLPKTRYLHSIITTITGN